METSEERKPRPGTPGCRVSLLLHSQVHTVNAYRTRPPPLPWGLATLWIHRNHNCLPSDRRVKSTHMFLLLFTPKQSHRTMTVPPQCATARASLSHLPVATASGCQPPARTAATDTRMYTQPNPETGRAGCHRLALPASTVVVLAVVVVAVEDVPEQEDTAGRRGRGHSASLLHLLL